MAKTTVCMCGGVWVCMSMCVLTINTGSADTEVTEATGALCLSAHPGAGAPNRGSRPLCLTADSPTHPNLLQPGGTVSTTQK